MTKDKGKKLEGDFKDVMKVLEKNPLTYSYRIPDARTTTTFVKGKARGKLSKRPGDYFVFHRGKAHLIELKEVAHDYRISTSRFTQIPKMRRFSMTGNAAGAIVYHTTNNTWRYVSIDYLALGKNKPSYDLSEVKQYKSIKELCLDKICRH